MSNFIDTIYSINNYVEPNVNKEGSSNTLILVPTTSDLDFATTFFNKLFKALNINSDTEAQILSFDQIQPINLVLIKEIYNPNVLVLAGISLGDLDVQTNLELHNPVHWSSIFILTTDSPQVLENKPKQHKADFWQAFKSAYL
jgi:hypothetical protein